ncbi:Hypothetical protein CINCED_3A007379 [Cinara cedri]|uniref:Ig-like domain-containing protein n=1 Tax=Cinara cedri TaxID=506608 RepID=A0A5E4MLP7_9HEMI|nr:Hypothetical protein CINCED_3A007379 [Cinara cedri]
MLAVYPLFILSLLYHTKTIYSKNDLCLKVCSCHSTFVKCSNASLTSVPDSLPQWSESLDLSSNKFGETLKIDIDDRLPLRTLLLNKNSLISLPFFTKKLNIISLNLAHNKIEKLDYIALQNLPNLETLDLKQNKLVFLKDNNFPQPSYIQTLNLNNNLISQLNVNCFVTLTNLIKLKLSHNKLNSLPIGLFKKLRNLKYLDLSKNNITIIEGLLFKDLINLEKLILQNNNIKDLKDGSFYGLKNLKRLHLEDNNLSSIEKGWLYGLNSLTILNISHNRIDQIKSGWEYCAELLELDLSFNELQCIEKSSLENLNKLTSLNLNNNKLTFIEEGSFNNTPSIAVLNMDHNILAWLIEDAKGSFNGLTNLKKLSLADTNILYIKKEAFCGLDNLEELNLMQNSIQEIQEDAFKCMPNLDVLYLNSSSLVCDCSLSWIKQPKVYENLPLDFTNISCGFPDQNKGKNLDQISESDFLCVKNSEKPMIIFHPESKMVLENQNITLKCGVNSSSSEKINFVWKKDNRDLEFVSMNHYSSFEFNGITQYSILNLYNISMSQSGKYQCVASNKHGITYSNRSSISVVIFPFFAKVPGNSSVKVGQQVKLECAANGHPAPQISWQKDGGNDFPAAQERRMQVVAKDDVFLIVHVKLVDMGIYSCTAKNVAGMIAANATLTVLEPPQIKNVMEKKQVYVGEEIVLECLSYGSPKPKMKWMKNGIPLITTSRHYFTAENQILVIVKTNIDDSGTYQCETANSYGIQMQEMEVLILPIYKSFMNKYIIGLIIILVIICIIIASAMLVLYIYGSRNPLLGLLNNADNKSLNYSTHSNDSGTGESPKRSHGKLFNQFKKLIIILRF